MAVRSVSPRAEARSSGGMFYLAKNRCTRCQSRFRWTATGECIICRQARERSPRPLSNHASAEANGLKFYVGSACRNCGSTLRYTSNSGCVECQKEMSRNGWAVARTTVRLNSYGTI